MEILTEYFNCPNCNKDTTEKLDELYGKISVKEFLNKRHDLINDVDSEETLEVSVQLGMTPLDSTLTITTDVICEDCGLSNRYKTQLDVLDRKNAVTNDTDEEVKEDESFHN